MTLLPDKHIPTNRSLIGVGALLLEYLEYPLPVSGLWDEVKSEQQIGSFHNFVLTLNYLYTIGALELEQGLLIKAK